MFNKNKNAEKKKSNVYKNHNLWTPQATKGSPYRRWVKLSIISNDHKN